MPDAADPIRAEAQIVRNTEKLPRSELVEKILIRWLGEAETFGPCGSHKLWADVCDHSLGAGTGRARPSGCFYASRIEEAQSSRGSRGDRWRPGGNG